MSQVIERIRQLQQKMKERNIDGYLIPTADYHESEYVGEHFACGTYMTGFTGSAGTTVVMKDWVGLWTDGRYFVQAEKELKGSGIQLMKMGEKGVPSVEEYLEAHLPKDGILGFDGCVVNAQRGEDLKIRLKRNNITLAYTEDLVGEVWNTRPSLPAEKVWILEQKYCGREGGDKLMWLRASMDALYATVHVITTLDDIVWLLNIRGNDIPCTPVVLSYLVVTKEDVILFVNPETLDQTVCQYLQDLGVTIQVYQGVYAYVQNLRGETILLEKGKVNYTMLQSLDDTNQVIDKMNPTVLEKSKKNSTEIKNIKEAHIKDGIALTKFLYWMKKNIDRIPMTEISASDYLEKLRRDQGCLDFSFSTISAYGPNAAMCHYHAHPENCAILKPKGLYLIDSGGQYLEGTTDVTRTMALGPVTQEEKTHYTLVLMGMLRLGHAKFLKGCSGLSLDYIAREPLWSHGLDYNHGTGHGIGYVLGVHERPVGIRFRVVPERQDSAAFEPGMVCSDEPGFYMDGSHGIRIENQMFCKAGKTTPYGQFLEFEFFTCVPIDLEPVEVSFMEDRDLLYLNEYHSWVYETIASHLTKEEAEWLKQVTAPISRT